VDIEELSDEVQFSVKDNPTEKRDKEWQEEAFKAGEVLIEGFDGIFHVVLYELENLCMEEFLEEMLRCFLSEEKDKEEADNEK
jgi:hypothetical protein